jgi:hypothetical protein
MGENPRRETVSWQRNGRGGGGWVRNSATALAVATKGSRHHAGDGEEEKIRKESESKEG